MAGIKDVAKAAGVSVATVSRVLSNGQYVSDDVRQRVYAAVEALHYRPNRVAQSLRSKKSSIIGLIVADIQNPFFTEVSRAVQDRAYESGYNVFLCNTDEKPEKESDYIELMQEENVAGIIISPTHQSDASVKKILSLKIPLVVIDRRVKGMSIDSVCINNREAAGEVTRHLIEMGYRHIAALIGSGSTTGEVRFQGMLQAFQEYNISPDDYEAVFTNATREDGYRRAMELLQSEKRPDAIFTTNGLLAAGVYQALIEKKISIPDEIGFATFDETDWTSFIYPQVTVVSQPTQDIGRTAVDLLVQKIDDPMKAVQDITLKSTLVVRKSTVPAGKSSK